MLTRRHFLGTLAALAASRVAPVPVAAAPIVEWKDRLYTLPQVSLEPYLFTPLGRVPRRDDGDTILELR